MLYRLIIFSIIVLGTLQYLGVDMTISQESKDKAFNSSGYFMSLEEGKEKLKQKLTGRGDRPTNVLKGREDRPVNVLKGRGEPKQLQGRGKPAQLEGRAPKQFKKSSDEVEVTYFRTR